MPAQAPDTRSVPYSQGRVNPRIDRKSQYRARREMVTHAARNRGIPRGAACLLVEYDNWGWRYGVAFPYQEGLARRMGVTVRTIQRWTKALQDAGYIAKTERTGRACRHTLAWAAESESDASGAAEMSHRVAVDMSSPIVPEARSIEAAAPEPSAPVADDATLEPSDCLHCGGTGERVYHVPAQIGAGGTRITASTWRGWCGCRPKGAIMRDCETRGSSDA
jgi:hypothetical protein